MRNKPTTQTDDERELLAKSIYDREERHLRLAAMHLAAAETGYSPNDVPRESLVKWTKLVADLFQEEG